MTTYARLAAALADRYAIQNEVGAGGMATVYLAHDVKHDRAVAVKVLRPDLAAVVGAERFLREVKLTARLEHPHILTLIDSGEADGFLYYVMPYIEGESLRERLTREGELPVDEAVRILREMADALYYAHGQGIVHRDIKPDNVMFSSGHVVVTDFGVAKAVSNAAPQSSPVTTAGSTLGTPAYMAPEQATADPNVDHRVDIYALGCVAYELLTGRPPFTGESMQQLLSAHVTQAPDPVSRYRATVPDVLEQLTMRCLEKHAADRWQSAADVQQQLAAIALSTSAATPVAVPPAARSERLGRNAMVTAAAIALLAAGAWWLGTRSGADGARSSIGADATPSIAVLPFTDPSAEGDEQYFGDGMAETLIYALNGVDGLRVAAQTSEASNSTWRRC